MDCCTKHLTQIGLRGSAIQDLVLVILESFPDWMAAAQSSGSYKLRDMVRISVPLPLLERTLVLDADQPSHFPLCESSDPRLEDMSDARLSKRRCYH